MMAAILCQTEDVSNDSGKQFPDVIAGSRYADAIAWAAGQELMNGYTDGSFRPDEAITRQQLAAVLYRYGKLKGCDMASGTVDLSDGADVSGWAVSSVCWAVDNGLLSTSGDGAFHPAGTVTGSEVETIMALLDNLIQK